MVWGSKLLASVEVMSLGVSLICIDSAGECKEWLIISGAVRAGIFCLTAGAGGFAWAVSKGAARVKPKKAPPRRGI
jgi:hypothetical protein